MATFEQFLGADPTPKHVSYSSFPKYLLKNTCKLLFLLDLLQSYGTKLPVSSEFHNNRATEQP